MMKKGSLWKQAAYGGPKAAGDKCKKRLYTSPSKKVNEALDTVFSQSTTPINILPLATQQLPHSSTIQSFLRRRVPYTLLPAPLPSDHSSPLNDFYFTDSPTQDHLAIMDACLHNAYNVPRAQAIFSRLRLKSTQTPHIADTGPCSLLTTRVYNEFLDVYLGLATAALAEESGSSMPSSSSSPGVNATQSLDNIFPRLTLNSTLKGQWRTSNKWISTAWDLYDVMESESENVTPDANTYATMLLFYLRCVSFIII